MTDEAYRRGYDLIDWSKPLPKIEKPRTASARGAFPCPMMIRDFSEPVQSMADGKWYSSKRALAASHKASGNPHGQDFIELGNDTPETKEFVPDAKQRRNDIKQAMHDVVSGNLPPEIAAIE